jgi:dihydrofolate reductase (trimethoprim resistance protein)
LQPLLATTSVNRIPDAKIPRPRTNGYWQLYKSSGFHKRLNMEQSSVAVGASHDHQIQPPLPATFGLGERVRKKSGAAWQGHIVGWYSTKLTPEGYAVESEAHPGSVQIYPVAALERVA